MNICRHVPLILAIKMCWSVFENLHSCPDFSESINGTFSFIPGYKQHSLALNWEYNTHEPYWSRRAVDSNFTISGRDFHLKYELPLQHYFVHYTVPCNIKIIFCKQYSIQFSLLLEIKRERRINPPKSHDQFATVGNGTTDAKLGSWSDPTEQRIDLCMFEESWVGSGSLIDSAREINQSCNLKCKSFKYSLIPVLQQLYREWKSWCRNGLRVN